MTNTTLSIPELEDLSQRCERLEETMTQVVDLVDRQANAVVKLADVIQALLSELVKAGLAK